MSYLSASQPYLSAGNSYAQGSQAYLGGGTASYAHSPSYDRQAEQHASESLHASQEHVFVPDDFLSGIPTRILNSQEELLPLVEETFTKTTGQHLPNDIVFTICPESAFAKAFGPGYTEGILGFCRNRAGWGVSEIYVKQSDLAHVMLTLGHEIGHALTKPLPDARDEEAKAFAFSLAWIETVKEHNIGGIAHAVHPRPAENGLHNVAYHFILAKGQKFLETFVELAKGTLSIIPQLETIIM